MDSPSSINTDGIHPIVLPIVCCFVSWRLRRPHWGNADEAEGIFGFCRTREGCGPASKTTLKKTPLSPTPPSLSPLSTPRLFYRFYSETRTESSTSSPSKTHSRAKSVAGRDRQSINAFYFCSDILDSPIIDHQIKRTLIPLTSLKTVDNKEIPNPYLFRGAPTVNTFDHHMSNRTRAIALCRGS